MVTGQQEGVARLVLAMTNMADNKIESVGIVSQKSVDDHGHGHDEVLVGKAEGDLGQNHLISESLWVEMEKRILAQKAHLSASHARCNFSILAVHPVQVHLAHVVKQETEGISYI